MDLEDIQSEYERVNSQVAISEKKLMTFDKVDNLTSYFASLKEGFFNTARCTRFELLPYKIFSTVTMSMAVFL